ncbi:hypothetical protein ACK8QS_22275 (plasmid) [Ectopseudomonas mendocina]
MTAITGWQRIRPARYRHDDGAVVHRAPAGAEGWQLVKPCGRVFTGFDSRQEAMRNARLPIAHKD